MRASHDPRDDTQLVAATLAGDGDAFGELYRRHAVAVLGYCWRRCGNPHDAADLCAETFAEALLVLRRWNPDRGLFGQWLYGIAHNKWRRWVRTGATQQRAIRRLGLQVRIDDDDIDRLCDLIDTTALINTLKTHLQHLDPLDAAIVERRVIRQRPYDEIGRQLGLRPATVRQRLSRTLRRLSELADPPTGDPL